MNCGDLEALVIEIDNVIDKNAIVNLVYKPPNGSIKVFHEYLKLFLDRTTISNKNIVLIGDFNLNLLDFYHSHSVKIAVTKLFKNNLLTLINKPARVTSKFISAIGHIFFYINSNFKSSSIIKTNFSDHLAIFMTCRRSGKVP